MLHAARYYELQGGLLVLDAMGGAPPNAELLGVGVLDESGDWLTLEMTQHQGEHLDAS